jgi:uncharacterized protein
MTAKGPSFDAEGVEVLPEGECLRLLTTQPVGRLVFHEEGLPAVRLVNFVVADGTVVFRTAGGQTYDAARRGDVVAFEVDEYDIDTHSGWTVTAVGHAWTVTDEAEAERIAALPVRPWAAGKRPHWVRVDIEAISGRRLLPWGRQQRD